MRSNTKIILALYRYLVLPTKSTLFRGWQRKMTYCRSVCITLLELMQSISKYQRFLNKNLLQHVCYYLWCFLSMMTLCHPQGQYEQLTWHMNSDFVQGEEFNTVNFHLYIAKTLYREGWNDFYFSLYQEKTYSFKYFPTCCMLSTV